MLNKVSPSLIVLWFAALSLSACSSFAPQSDWRQSPVKYMEGTWTEQLSVEGLTRRGTYLATNDATQFVWDSKWNSVTFYSSCSFGDTSIVTTERYVVNLRENDPQHLDFYFIPSGGPTIPVRRLPLTHSPDASGFRGSGEAVEGDMRIPVDVSIEFAKDKPGHVWTIGYKPTSQRPLVFTFRFSR